MLEPPEMICLGSAKLQSSLKSLSARQANFMCESKPTLTPRRLSPHSLAASSFSARQCFVCFCLLSVQRGGLPLRRSFLSIFNHVYKVKYLSDQEPPEPLLCPAGYRNLSLKSVGRATLRRNAGALAEGRSEPLVRLHSPFSRGPGEGGGNLYTRGGTSEEFTVVFPGDTKDFTALVPAVTMPYGARG